MATLGSLAIIAYDIWEKAYSIIRVAVKWVLHKVTNSSELSRICAAPRVLGTAHRKAIAQTAQFARSLKLSKKLKTVSSIVFYPKPFKINSVLPMIVTTKAIPPEAQPTAVACLTDIRIINLVINKLDSLKKEKYSEATKDSVRRDLEELWSNLRPDVRLTYDTQATTNDSLHSNDWGDIGFQGKDPTTDFRGMGLLGLQQLLHFSRTRPESARKVLLECNHHVRYLPFAATGINMSAFVHDLLQDCTLHVYLLHNVVGIQDFVHSHDDETALILKEKALIQSGVDLVNDLYCDIYEAFIRVWVERNPPNIMSFQSIFSEFKVSYRSKFTPL